MSERELDVPSWVGWLEEAGAVGAYLGSGLLMVEQRGSRSSRGPAVLALLATGMERLAKLTIASIRLEESGGEWPAAELKGFRHRVRDLDSTARTLIDERASLSTAPGAVHSSSEALRADTRLPMVLTAVDDWARGGRYWGFDLLAENPSVRPTPSTQLWSTVVDVHVTLEQSARLVNGDAHVRDEMHEAVAATIRAWWDHYHLAWTTDVCGNEAKNYGAMLERKAAVASLVEPPFRAGMDRSDDRSE